MHLGDIVRVLEVPAQIPAETAPAALPVHQPAAPVEPAKEPEVPAGAELQDIAAAFQLQGTSWDR